MSTLFSHFFTKINQIAPLEADFTEVLDAIALKPKMLYFYGNLPQNVSKTGLESASLGSENRAENALKTGPNSGSKTGSLVRPKTVAIVGSRRNTRYGAEVAYDMAYQLAKRGVIIVSGLAYGIDSIGHQACLDAGGTTVAVLGTPIDQIYPKNHLKLAADIIEKGGAVMSEYAPRDLASAPLAPGEAGWNGEEWLNPLLAKVKEDPSLIERDFEKRNIDKKFSFLYRNRLISGLADVVVVVEAAERSGTLNTAAHALEQGKEVFAVPGNVNSPFSVGCNRLIAQGATPYTCPDDVLRLLFPEDYLEKPTKAVKIQGDSPVETAILKAIAEGTRDGEQIAAKLKLSPEIFSRAITLLEIKGAVHSLGANNWSWR